MALHFAAMVNGEPICSVVIQRLESLDGRESDTYDYEVKTTNYRDGWRRATCTHRYSDSALVLIRRALEAIEEGS